MQKILKNGGTSFSRTIRHFSPLVSVFTDCLTVYLRQLRSNVLGASIHTSLCAVDLTTDVLVFFVCVCLCLTTNRSAALNVL